MGNPPLGYMAPPSREWRRDTRRGGYATMTLAVLVGYTWVSASQQLVVLANGQIRHAASWWGWPLIASALLLIAGAYVVLATYFDRWPILGREWTEVDHSTRYALWFQGLNFSWGLSNDKPGMIDCVMTMILSNGGDAGPIRAHFEKFLVELNGLKPTGTESGTRDLRLLPSETKTRYFRLGLIQGLPEGEMQGVLEYSISYGPPTGFPVYRRTHKIRFWQTFPITLDMVTTGDFGLTTIQWADIEPEEDADVPGYMPPIALASPGVQPSAIEGKRVADSPSDGHC
jgi:hypothetical protein